MGDGSYSIGRKSLRDKSMGYDTKSTREIFKETQINNAMNPHGIKIRESRDSKEHPNSLAIVLGLDVTGSMGSVPHFLVKEGLPKIMDDIIKSGIKDPQVLFLGIGDHENDEAPLQVGQFESSDALLDKWLTSIYLEGGGGANYGESYALAWYFALQHTSTDCFEKRGKKGFLFTIGDEPVLPNTPKSFLKKLMGEGQYKDYSATVLLDKVKEKYEVYHIHIRETNAGSSQETVNGWKKLLGKNLIIAKKRQDVEGIISRIVSKGVTRRKLVLDKTG